MYLLIIFLSLLNFFNIFFFKHFLNNKEILVLNCLNILISLILTFISFYEVIYIKTICYCFFFLWIDFNFIYLDWFFLFDFLSITMCFVILLISFLVHLYSIEYMFYDLNLLKFMSYLSLFTFFMLILVTSGNLLQLFLGWEGVGLSSYLLINFWNTRIAANKAAMKAIIVNRISDFALYFGLFSIFYLFKTLDISLLNIISQILLNISNIYFTDFFLLLTLTCFFFFFGAMGKSAQLGLHTWLPDAMEGPTPVSALIHAATMVTAGIFLLIRLSFLFIYCSTVLLFILLIGSLTTFFAGSVGCFQHDIKKIIAYSTCSQLGYMVISCGLVNFNIALFHLFNHAFFKALLFLGAGSIIHVISDEQDIRKYGGLHKLLPITYISFFIASFSIAGFPFLTGFYSKDLILEIEAFSILYLISFNFYFFWILSVFSIFFTIFYSFRIIFYSFFGYPNFILNSFLIKESSFLILFSLLILSFLSLFIGFFFKDLFIGPNLDNFINSVYITFYNEIIFNIEFLIFIYKFYPLVISSLSFICFIYFIIFFKNIDIFNFFLFDLFFFMFFRFFNQKWFFDLLYIFIFQFPILNWSYFITFKLIDRGFLEYFGSFTFVQLFYKISNKISLWSSGFIYHYMFIFFFNILVLFFYFFYNLFFFNLKIFFSIYNFLGIILFIFFVILFKKVKKQLFLIIIINIILYNIFFFKMLKNKICKKPTYNKKYLVTQETLISKDAVRVIVNSNEIIDFRNKHIPIKKNDRLKEFVDCYTYRLFIIKQDSDNNLYKIPFYRYKMDDVEKTIFEKIELFFDPNDM